MTRLMRSIRGMLVLAFTLSAVVGLAAPAAAAMASIVTVAPLDDDATEEGLKTAAASALGRAVRGAQAMGLGEVMLKSIRVEPGIGVMVEILASDSASEPSLEDSASRPEAPSRAGDSRI